MDPSRGRRRDRPPALTQTTGAVAFTADGGDLDLSSLASVAGDTSSTWTTEFDSQDGGQVNLDALAQVVGNVEFSADGDGSMLNLPGLASITGSTDGTWSIWISATTGGEIDLPALTQTTGDVDFYASSGALLNLPGLASITGSTDATWYPWFDAEGGEIDLGTTSLSVQGGATFYADGDGSLLSLPGLASITGSTDGTWYPWFDAKDGGEIDLDLLTQATGDLGFQADGGTLDLPDLASITGSTDGTPDLPDLASTTDSTDTIWYPWFEADDGGEINLPALTQVTDFVGFTANGSGSVVNLTGLTSLAGSTDGSWATFFNATAGGEIDLDALTQVTGAVTFSASGGTLDLPVLESITGNSDGNLNMSFSATDGGEIDFGADTLQAEDVVSFTADGAGSLLNLPNVASITGNTDGNEYWTFSVQDGGELDFDALNQAMVYLSFSVSDAESAINLPSLTDLNGGCYFDVSNSAQVDLAALTQVTDGLYISTWDPDCVVNAPSLTSIAGGGEITVVGGTVELPALTQSTGYFSFSASGSESILNLASLASFSVPDGTTMGGFDADGGAEIDLPALTEATGSINFIATGSGSILSLTGLTSIAGSSDGSWYTDIDADGGQVECPALTQATGYLILTANGGSIDLSALQSLAGTPTSADGSGTQGGPEIQVLASGSVELGTAATTTTVSNVVVDVGSTGSLATSQLMLGQGASLQGLGSITGNMNNASIVRPGDADQDGNWVVGDLTIDGDYVQAANGLLQVDLNGPTDNGQLVVTGTASLDGTLSVSLLGGFTPSKGDSFQIMSFATFNGLLSGLNTPNGVAFTPIYDAESLSIQVPIPVTPVITWSNPADITYGTAVRATQLDATASVPGTFTYSPVAGTMLHAGAGQRLSATFTPTDGLDYSLVTVSVTINILKATPTLTWAEPADITYGTALGTTQLDATASVPGTFTYSPAAATVLSQGEEHVLSVTFTPTDSTDYNSVSGSTLINVLPVLSSPPVVAPVITWSNPADITYGTALGAAQLDATTSVAGTFTYSPAAGMLLHAGAGQRLSVTFTPTDSLDYSSATASVTINVLKATPTLTWADPADITYGTALGASQLDATASVPGTFTYSPAAAIVLSQGQGQVLSVTFTPTDSADYKSVYDSTTINVLPSAPPPPVVTGFAGVNSSKKGLTSVTLAFNGALDPDSANNPGLFSVRGAVKKRGKTVYTKVLHLKGVRYDDNSHTVTISLAKPYKGPVQVTVLGGIAGADGASSLDDTTMILE